jgi:hypothetical protein
MVVMKKGRNKIENLLALLIHNRQRALDALLIQRVNSTDYCLDISLQGVFLGLINSSSV